MRRDKMTHENRVVDLLMDGEATASFLCSHSGLCIRTIRGVLGQMVMRGEVEVRTAADRSGEVGRIQTLYALAKTQRKRA